MSDLGKFLSTVWKAASAAGALIRENWERPRTIEYKGAIDLVTSVDREAERQILEILQREFPDHGFLSEEAPAVEARSKEYQWIIDPLDGTTNFAHGYPHLSVSVALQQNGRTILGLVYDPLRNECFRAVAGQGAFLNDAPIRVSPLEQLDKALLATGFPYDRRQHADKYLAFFRAFLTRTQGIRRAGSAALDLCYVASGRIDGFWELKLKPWDVAAGALIVAEAGGKVSDFSGNPLSIFGDETLASNGLVHREMAQIIADLQRGGVD
jgi:myo-inositol-1(or 4)-monophosphatase